MKKTAITLLSFAAFAFSIASCHYGQDEAKQTLERNEQYKSEKAEYSVNRAGGDAPKAEAAPVDSTQ
ncbi:MAG: hypothetical protein MUE96_10970 [Bacteroidia bacterium]|nr:hypothetical protein [Bacteroidia bacterium]